jgi:hypothetical protein
VADGGADCYEDAGDIAGVVAEEESTKRDSDGDQPSCF